MSINETYAPKGCKAVAPQFSQNGFAVCNGCKYDANLIGCSNADWFRHSCISYERPDGCDVIFVQIENEMK